MPPIEPPARRRSTLVVPGSDPRKTAKALASDADAVVIDLEDAVEPGSKDAARQAVVAALAEASPDLVSRVAVRVNPAGSPWCHLDVAALAEAPQPPAALVLPKVDGPADLAFLDRLLDGVEARAASTTRLGVHALVETARGVANVAETARASKRLQALVIGYADLAASLGMTAPPDRRLEMWLPVQSAVLVAARAAGVAALDGPYLGVDVDDRFAASARRARDLGFDGKWAIHPRQVAALNEVFQPDEADVAYARRVVEVLAQGHRGATGAVLLDGQMIDEAVAVEARRVLAQAGELR